MVKSRKQTLKQKALNWTAGIGFTITSLFNAGCFEEMTRYQAYNARTARQAAAINLTADIIGAEEQYQRDLEIARQGRTQVNIYGSGGQNPETPLSPADRAKARRAYDQLTAEQARQEARYRKQARRAWEILQAEQAQKKNQE
jgi:hypothetical protein